MTGSMADKTAAACLIVTFSHPNGGIKSGKGRSSGQLRRSFMF